MPILAPYIDAHTHDCPAEELCESLVSLRVGSESDMAILERCQNPFQRFSQRFSVGIHPWDVVGGAPPTEEHYRPLFEELFRAPNVVALGEVGLDFVRARSEGERRAQVLTLQWQVAWGAERKLPLVLHQVRATEQLLPLLRGYPAPIILHGFSGSPQEVAQWLRLSERLYLSFGRTLERSPKVQQALAATPRTHLLLESDTDSFSSLLERYVLAAKLLGESEAQLREALYVNWQAIWEG